MTKNMDTKNKHILKTHPLFFAQIAEGTKCWELRKNDRNFKIGDTLILREYNPLTKRYTDLYLVRTITAIFSDDNFGLQKNFVILSIQWIPFSRVCWFIISAISRHFLPPIFSLIPPRWKNFFIFPS